MFQIKVRKATKHERKYLLKEAGSDGALYETKEIIVDATRNKEAIFLAIIHELCEALGMAHEEAVKFEERVLKIVEK